MVQPPELPKRLSRATVQADAPAAGFFLLGTGAGVCLTLLSHPVAFGFAAGAFLVGALILTSRYFGFPIPGLRPQREQPVHVERVEIKDLHLHDLHMHIEGGPIAQAVSDAIAEGTTGLRTEEQD